MMKQVQKWQVPLPAKAQGNIKIAPKNYKPVDEKVEIAVAKEGPTTVVKHYLLYKE